MRSSYAPAGSRALVGPRPVMPKLYEPGSRSRSRAITPTELAARGVEQDVEPGDGLDLQTVLVNDPARLHAEDRRIRVGGPERGTIDRDAAEQAGRVGPWKPSAEGNAEDRLSPTAATATTPVTSRSSGAACARTVTCTRAARPTPQDEMGRRDLECKRFGVAARGRADGELKPTASRRCGRRASGWRASAALARSRNRVSWAAPRLRRPPTRRAETCQRRRRSSALCLVARSRRAGCRGQARRGSGRICARSGSRASNRRGRATRAVDRAVERRPIGRRAGLGGRDRNARSDRHSA